jgi:ADP-dependent NAD(P)H-hydrate dehydratase
LAMEEILCKINREKDTHKGENGKVAVIAGSKDYTGAPAIAAKAAYRSGTDLVKILTSEQIQDTVASYSENLIVSGYSGGYFTEEDVDQAEELLEWCDAAVIGPGLSQPEPGAVKQLLEKTDAPVIVDADAIEPAAERDRDNVVFAPHKGEKKHIEDRSSSVEDFATEDRVVVVKGKVDKIYSEKRYTSRTGSAAMTVGGTGDMLAGIIAALISQGLSLTEASRLGVWLNGKAGEKAAEAYGNGALPTDMIEEIPKILFQL